LYEKYGPISEIVSPKGTSLCETPVLGKGCPFAERLPKDIPKVEGKRPAMAFVEFVVPPSAMRAMEETNGTE
jgi:hypothetical protein